MLHNTVLHEMQNYKQFIDKWVQYSAGTSQWDPPTYTGHMHDVMHYQITNSSCTKIEPSPSRIGQLLRPQGPERYPPLLAPPRSVQLTAGTLLHVCTATQSAPCARLPQSQTLSWPTQQRWYWGVSHSWWHVVRLHVDQHTLLDNASHVADSLGHKMGVVL